MNIDELIRDLPDAELLSAWEIACEEIKKRFPHLAHTPTEEELANPELMAKMLDEQRAAYLKARGMKAS